MRTVLENPDLCDSFELEVVRHVTVHQAAQHLFQRPPEWIGSLLLLRNPLMKPFGVVTSERQLPPNSERFGMFTVIRQEHACIILGLDDRHLDFRIVLEVGPADAKTSRVSFGTNVKCHNILGRTYLKAVRPFHRLIAPAVLARLSG